MSQEFEKIVLEKLDKMDAKIDSVFDAYRFIDTKVKINECITRDLKSKEFQHEVRISSLEDIIKKNSATA